MLKRLLSELNSTASWWKVDIWLGGMTKGPSVMAPLPKSQPTEMGRMSDSGSSTHSRFMTVSSVWPPKSGP